MTITKAVDLLSGPGGLASFVRQRQLGEKLAGPSLPRDNKDKTKVLHSHSHSHSPPARTG
jgi:hypothetical protein